METIKATLAAIIVAAGDKVGHFSVDDDEDRVWCFGYKIAPNTYGDSENFAIFKDGKYYLNNRSI